jgi:ATP-dependent Lon protease
VVCFDEVSGISLLTDHFGLVSDFLSECWTQLRNQTRLSCLQNKVFYSGALSGRDTNAVNKIPGSMNLRFSFVLLMHPSPASNWGLPYAVNPPAILSCRP